MKNLENKFLLIVFIIAFLFIMVSGTNALEITRKGEIGYEYLSADNLLLEKAGDKVILAKNLGSFIKVIYPANKIKSYSFLKVAELKDFDEIRLNNFCRTSDNQLAVSLAAGHSNAEVYNSLVSIVNLQKGFKPVFFKEKIIDYQNFVYVRKNTLKSLCSSQKQTISNKTLSLLINGSSDYLTFSPDLKNFFVSEEKKGLFTWNLFKRNNKGDYLKTASFRINNKIPGNSYLFIKWATDSSYVIVSTAGQNFLLNQKGLAQLNFNSLNLNPETLVCLPARFYFSGSDKSNRGTANNLLIKYDIGQKKIERRQFTNIVAMVRINNNEILITDKKKGNEQILNLDFIKVPIF